MFQRLAELLLYELHRIAETLLKVLSVLLAAHSEIWEVVEEVTESLLAVFRVFSCIKNMIMPERIDGIIDDDRLGSILKRQQKKAAIPKFNFVYELWSPPFATVPICQFDFDWFEVQ